jgi:peptidoglycan/xylan/chitin deacetylase (PgdA/CDA1 family)
MMTFDELALLAEEGHEIGSHSHSHPILPTVDDASLREELEQSRATLEKRLKRSVTSLCYPNGDADARVVQAARVAGYQRAVTTRWGWNARGADPFLLERCDMTGAEARASTGQLSRAQVAFRMSGLYPGLR